MTDGSGLVMALALKITVARLDLDLVHPQHARYVATHCVLGLSALNLVVSIWIGVAHIQYATIIKSNVGERVVL